MLKRLCISAVMLVIGVASLGVWLVGCAVIGGPSSFSSTAQDRLASLDLHNLPLEHEVSISWDKHAIPLIDAGSDSDGFFALGFVHAHLRLGQMELLRRAVQGKLSELLGPFANDIDATLRILDIGKAAPGILQKLPLEQKKLLQRFTDGINAYIERTPQLPFEFVAFDLPKTLWSPEDVIRVSRLASVDFTWIAYVTILLKSENGDRELLWKNFLAFRNEMEQLIKKDSGPVGSLSHLFALTGRLGSNAAVVSGQLTESGSPLLFSDPHLGVSIPNFWLIAGLKSPSYHVVGLMIPATPFFALGRNKHAAWGGTNLRAISSHLYDVSTVPFTADSTKADVVRTRWWFDKEISWRETPYGPVITDAPLFSEGKPIALNWLGHRDDGREFSAFFNLAKVNSWSNFREIFQGYYVPGLAMVYADEGGDIGALSAYTQLLPSDEQFFSLVKDPSTTTPSKVRTQNELPIVHNNGEGFIVSANNEISPSIPPVSYLPPLLTRRERLEQLIEEKVPVSLSDAQEIQQDTLSLSSQYLKRLLNERLRGLTDLSPETSEVRELLKNWDARYEIDSRGALAFEHLGYKLIERLDKERQFTDSERRVLKLGGYWKGVLSEALSDSKSLPDSLLLEELNKTSSYLKSAKAWGDVHRLQLQYPLGNIPVLGRSYRFKNYPAYGTDDTIYKSGAQYSPEGSIVSFGSQARHISDLSDDDANYFVLLGGQDGWLLSPQTLDQVEVWRDRKYLQLPLTAMRRPDEVKVLLRPSEKSVEETYSSK